MRILKALLTILIIITAILAIYGMTLPKSFSVNKSIQIDTFQKRIFPYVGDLKNHPKWSPWFEMDPNMTMTYSGDSQSIGQKVYWVSENPEVGHGSQEITDIDPSNSVTYKLSFGENGEYGGATAKFNLLINSDGANVTWSLKSDENTSIISRYFSKFVMEDAVNQNFEQGLEKLKIAAEEGL